MKLNPDMIESLPCAVQLPDNWGEGTGNDDSCGAVHQEGRRHRRWKFCSSAALQYRQSFPSMRRPPGWHRVYTVNLARGGLSFLHSEQLFPQEWAEIVFLDGSDRQIEIMRCRWIQDRCFEIGARFEEFSGMAQAAAGASQRSP